MNYGTYMSIQNVGGRVISICAVAAALSLAGCGEDGGAASTQVAARVNSDEITVHQINAVLSQSRRLTSSDPQQAGTQVLERLIDQQLLVQQAEDALLDHDPRVLQVIDASRREILARAYLEQKAAAAGKPSEQEIDDYYAGHPALFAQRRIYKLQELEVRLPAPRQDELKRRVEAAGSLQEIVDWLKQQDIPYTASAGAKAAEQLPLELLPRFAAMKDGQLALLRQPEGVSVIHLAGSEARPIAREQAAPMIEQFLLNTRKAEFAKQEIARLRESAEIAYLGNFASSGGAAQALPPATETASAQAATGALERGAAGLQ